MMEMVVEITGALKHVPIHRT